MGLVRQDARLQRGLSVIKAEVARLRLRPRLDSRRGFPEHRKDIWPRRREGASFKGYYIALGWEGVRRHAQTNR